MTLLNIKIKTSERALLETEQCGLVQGRRAHASDAGTLQPLKHWAQPCHTLFRHDRPSTASNNTRQQHNLMFEDVNTVVVAPILLSVHVFANSYTPVIGSCNVGLQLLPQFSHGSSHLILELRQLVSRVDLSCNLLLLSVASLAYFSLQLSLEMGYLNVHLSADLDCFLLGECQVRLQCLSIKAADSHGQTETFALIDSEVAHIPADLGRLSGHSNRRTV